MPNNPRTTIGGIIAIGAVVGLFAHWIDTRTAVEILGIAGAWIGITGKDAAQ